VWFRVAESAHLRQLMLGIVTVLALLLGWHLVASIGGGDMPVVVSMLNSVLRLGRRRCRASC
jgi:NAD/NADP transhydrogenase beta subunit